MVSVRAGLEGKVRIRNRRHKIGRGACEPDDGRPGEPRDVCILRVHLDFSKVGAQFQLLLRAQVLVAEEDDASLRNQEGELILRPFSGHARIIPCREEQPTYPLLIGKILQLQAYDFGADVDGHISHLRTWSGAVATGDR